MIVIVGGVLCHCLHNFNQHFFFVPQDEFLDVIYWLRQIIAVILGVIWGVAPLKGFLGIAM